MDIPESAPRRSALDLIVRRPVGVWMVVLAIAVFGTVSLLRLPVSLLPEVNYPTLTVRTEYPGSAPGDVEKLVTERLERQLAVVADLVSYRSISRAGVSDIILEFAWDKRMDLAVQDVREKVDQGLQELPNGIVRPLILRYDPTLDPILRLALYPSRDGESDLLALRRTAEDSVRRALESGIEGVAAVRVRGGYEEEWRVELDEARLEQSGIGLTTVAERIRLENANEAGGILVSGDRESLVRTIGEILKPEELARLSVAPPGFPPIRIAELGQVVVGQKERDAITRVEGKESVEIEVFKTAESNLVEVAAAVKTKLFGKEWAKLLADGRLEAEFSPRPEKANKPAQGRAGPQKELKVFDDQQLTVAESLAEEGLRLRLLSDQSVFIKQSIDDVRDSAILGGLLAILVLLAFLRRLGPTLVIGIAIPISILATFAPFFLAGVSLNVMSLGGLALGVGMLVDSAIVVLESITRRRETGASITESAIFGTRDVGGAVLASTLTTIAVFLPIVFVEGVAGEFFRDQALAVVFSLVSALLAALFFVPMLASRAPLALQKQSLGSALHPLLRAPLKSLLGLKAAWMGLKRPPFWLIPLHLLRLPLEIAVHLPVEVTLRLLGTILLLVTLALGIAVALLVRGLGLLLWPFRKAFDAAWALTSEIFLAATQGALKAKALVILAALGLSALAALRIPDLGAELIPEVHQGSFAVALDLDVGTPVAATDATAKEAAQRIRRALEEADIAIAGISTAAGIARDVIAPAGEGPHTARIFVNLKREGDLLGLETKAFRVIREALDALPGIGTPKFERPALFSSKGAFEVELLGEDLAQLGAASAAVYEAMAAESSLKDLSSTSRSGFPEIVLLPNREQLAFHGLEAGVVARRVREKVLGEVSTRISRGDRKIDVLVRTPRSSLQSEEDLLRLDVSGGGRAPVPLREVARVQRAPGPAEIRRIQGERAVVLGANPENLDLEGAARRVESLITAESQKSPELFAGITARAGGQIEQSRKSLQALFAALGIAVLLVYIVMASQFESLLHPFIILFSVPLALVGAVYALDFLMIRLSVVVLIGAILLVGIVVNNAIVLIDAVNQKRRAGMMRDEALIAATRERLRPIAMTTATTVLGLLPLSLGLGEGSEIRRPMAITVIAGLISSTLLTLVVIPALYSLLAHKGSLVKESAPS